MPKTIKKGENELFGGKVTLQHKRDIENAFAKYGLKHNMDATQLKSMTLPASVLYNDLRRENSLWCKYDKE